MRAQPGFFRRQWIARPLAVFSGCFLLGVWIDDRLRLPLIWLAIVSAAVLLLTVCLRRTKLCFVLTTVLALLLGSARMQWALTQYAPVEAQFSVSFSGTVDSDPMLNAETERIVCTLRLHSVNGESHGERVRLYLRSKELPLEGVEYGCTISGTGHIWPADAATNPHEFDFRNYLLSDGIVGMAAAKLEDVSIEPGAIDFEGRLIQLRRAVSERIERLFPTSAALAHAFILGDRTKLASDVKESFRQTGVTHLICISGMHVSVLAMAVSWLLSKWHSHNHAVFLTIALVLLYGLLPGFSPTLIRATVMFAVFSLASVAGRPTDSVTRLCAALLGMLVFNPLYLYDGGFALSFWASAGIILLQPPLRRLLGVDALKARRLSPSLPKRILQKLARYFAELICTTLSAQLATLPLILSMFGAQSLLSLPVNLFAIPLAMLAYPIAIAGLALSYLLWPLGVGVAWIADRLFALLTALISACASLPVNELRAPAYPVWLFALHCALLLAGSELSRIPIRVRKWTAAALTGLLGVSMLCAYVGSLGFEVVFLDADQADAAVVRAAGKVCLFDVGDPYSPISDYVSATCLKVDAAFLSHPHYDHAGGLIELMETMPPRTIYVPKGWFEAEADDEVLEGVALAQSKNIPIVELSAGDQIDLGDDLTGEVLAPDGDEATVNDLSLVLRLTRRGRSVLFTGDVSMDGEPDFIPDADVLKVAHHGSKKSTSERFLEMADPEIAVVSVGENNYGHPSEETLERLRDAGAAVYRTDQCGAITIHVDPGGEMSVKTYLPRRAWKNDVE